MYHLARVGTAAHPIDTTITFARVTGGSTGLQRAFSATRSPMSPIVDIPAIAVVAQDGLDGAGLRLLGNLRNVRNCGHLLDRIGKVDALVGPSALVSQGLFDVGIERGVLGLVQAGVADVPQNHALLDCGGLTLAGVLAIANSGAVSARSMRAQGALALNFASG